MNNKVLVLLTHPLLEKSRVHRALQRRAQNVAGVHIHDLYEHYPIFNIDVHFEQKQLLKYDIIIWQHPVYWYSIPPLLKQWIDMVLDFGWAYGKGAAALEGKYLLQVFSSGGSSQVYTTEGRNKRPLRHYMFCHEQTAMLCKMHYLPPFVVHGTHQLSESEIEQIAIHYEMLLHQLVHTDLSNEIFDTMMYINEWKLKNQI
jgi:glutathione-regulated potassium-efflux system ancillary protein KefG